MRKGIIYIVLVIIGLSANHVYSQKKSKYFIKITFDKGPLKGTHVFTPEKGNYASQINLSFSDNISNINASKLVSESGFQIHYINRLFEGEPSFGNKEGTSECGTLNFIDLQNNQSYRRIDGKYLGCTKTKITKVSTWEKGIYYSKRDVSGNFVARLSMEIVKDDQSKQEIETSISVEFTVKESKRK